jgi:phosphoglycerol transferase
MNSFKKFLSILGKILFYLFVFISFLLAFSIRWGLTTWQNLKMDEMIFELTAPLEGTGDSYISDYILNGPIPALLITSLVLILFIVLIKKLYMTYTSITLDLLLILIPKCGREI